MSEENTNAQQEETVAENATVEEQNSVEAEAIAMGWTSKEEFLEKGGREEDFKGPGAYIKDAKLFETLKSQDTQIKDLKNTLSEVKDFMTKSEQKGYQKALDDIEAKKQEALQNEDVHALQQAYDAQNRIQQEMHASVPTQQAPESPAEVEAFKSRNATWFNDDNEENITMKNFAIAMEGTLMSRHPELSGADILNKVEEQVKKTFAHKFKNENRSQPPAVSTGASGAKKTSSPTVKLTDEQKSIGQGFVRAGLYKDLAEYAKELEKGGML